MVSSASAFCRNGLIGAVKTATFNSGFLKEYYVVLNPVA